MDEDDERVPRIGEIQIRVKPEFYLNKAREERTLGNMSKAFQYFVDYIECLDNPLEDIAPEDYRIITQVAVKLGSIFDEMNEEEQAIKCYIQMLNFFPKNVYVLNALSVYLFKRGEFEIARKYLVKAADEGYLPGEKNLLHVYWHLIPRWHYRMLNDKHRNQCYYRAIRRAIAAGFANIVDIGAGCGLLSMMAVDANKRANVLGYEENKTLFNMSQDILSENGFKIQVINDNSRNCLKFTGKCNLIVTEIFDAALFGENCLPTIYHALVTFVEKSPKFRIIPAKGKMYVTGFHSDKLANKYRFTKSLKKLNLENVCIKCIDAEPYDADYLRNQRVQYLTETVNFSIINFSDKNHLLTLLSETECLSPFNLKATADGTISALAVWFDLHLDEETVISTSPHDDDNLCWEQAIFHLDHPIPVKKNDKIRLKPRFVQNQLRFTVESPIIECPNCFYVSRDIVSFLNDTDLTDYIADVVDFFLDYDINVLDFNVFPLFGFLMCQKGATAYHIYKDSGDLRFFEYIMKSNNISDVRFVFIDEKTMSDYMLYIETLDYVFADLVKSDGSWNRLALTEESEKKFNSISLPQKIFLKAQLIQSDYLDFCNKVDDRNVLGFKIAKFMNKFSGYEHPCLDSLKHFKYSNEFVFDISDLSLTEYSMEVQATKNGVFNGILYWFEMQYFDDEECAVFSTLNSSYYEKTCTYLCEGKKVKKGDVVKIHVQRVECYLKVYCD